KRPRAWGYGALISGSWELPGGHANIAQGRKAVKMKTACVRMSPEDKERIARAARVERVSMSAFMLRAALAAAGNGKASPAGLLPDEGQVAVAALVEAGLTESEAARRVRRALAEDSKATADRLVAAAFAGGGR
ncbi:MAG: DUF1778 domain-containing protein, partial [Gemmatimonadota bacterium]